MAREFRHALEDIEAAIDGVLNAVAGKSLEDYRQDWLLKHAVQRGIEIISEASRALPDEITAIRAEIPWPRVRAIGNVLRHEYYSLADDIIWGVVIGVLPALKAAIQGIRERLKVR